MFFEDDRVLDVADQVLEEGSDHNVKHLHYFLVYHVVTKTLLPLIKHLKFFGAHYEFLSSLLYN